MAQIPDNDIKLFLDTLPSFDSGEISRRLYLDIIKTKKGLKPAYSAENLKLLCKDGKYHFNREIKYADRKISSSEEGNSNFIYKTYVRDNTLKHLKKIVSDNSKKLSAQWNFYLKGGYYEANN